MDNLCSNDTTHIMAEATALQAQLVGAGRSKTRQIAQKLGDLSGRIPAFASSNARSSTRARAVVMMAMTQAMRQLDDKNMDDSSISCLSGATEMTKTIYHYMTDEQKLFIKKIDASAQYAIGDDNRTVSGAVLQEDFSRVVLHSLPADEIKAEIKDEVGEKESADMNALRDSLVRLDDYVNKHKRAEGFSRQFTECRMMIEQITRGVSQSSDSRNCASACEPAHALLRHNLAHRLLPILLKLSGSETSQPPVDENDAQALLGNGVLPLAAFAIAAHGVGSLSQI